MIKIEWDTEWLPPEDQREALEQIIRVDLADNLGIDESYKPGRLMMHHVFLNGHDKGPFLFIFGKKGSDAFHCRYDHDAPRWMTLAETEAMRPMNDIYKQ